MATGEILSAENAPICQRPGVEIRKAIVDCWKSCIVDLAEFLST